MVFDLWKWGRHVRALSPIADTQQATPNGSESSRMGSRHVHFGREQELLFQVREMNGTRIYQI